MSFLNIQSFIEDVSVHLRPDPGYVKVVVRFGEPGFGSPRLSMSVAEAQHLRDQLSAAIDEAVAS